MICYIWGQRDWGRFGCVVRVSATKNNVNGFLFQNADIYLYPIPLGVVNTQAGKSCNIIYTSQNIKPLHRAAVGSPMNPPQWRSCFQWNASSWQSSWSSCRIELFRDRERLSEKVCTRQFRKAIWDVINIYCSWHCSCRTFFGCFPLAPANICPWPLVPFFQISLNNSELKTTHNAFWDCPVYFSDNLSRNSSVGSNVDGLPKSKF